MKFLLSHYRAVHLSDDDFNITCDFEGCGQQYSKCSSYVSHIYRRHRSFIMSDVSESVSMSDAGPSGVNEPCEVEQNDSDRSAGDVVHVDPHVMDQLLGLGAEQQQ